MYTQVWVWKAPGKYMTVQIIDHSSKIFIFAEHYIIVTCVWSDAAGLYLNWQQLFRENCLLRNESQEDSSQIRNCFQLKISV